MKLSKKPVVGPVAKYAHEKNHIDHPERAWLMWFFALELNCHEKTLERILSIPQLSEIINWFLY